VRDTKTTPLDGRGKPLTRRCGNCTRERLLQDVGWHREDREWYCYAVFECEQRLEILKRRGEPAVWKRNIDKSGVSL